MNGDYAGKISVKQYAATNVKAFDNDTLFPMKKRGELKGGLYLASPSATNQYIPYFLINTRSVTTPLLFPTIFAQSLINTLTATPITITLINSPLPRTYQSQQMNNAISGGAFIFSMALAFKSLNSSYS